MPQNSTPNVHGYIVANTRAVVVLNERINPLNLRAKRVQMINPFVLSSYGFDKHHHKASEQVQVRVTCFYPKYDLLCTRLLHRIIVSISAYGIIIKSQYMFAKLVNSHDALSIVSSPAGLKLVYQAPALKLTAPTVRLHAFAVLISP